MDEHFGFSCSVQRSRNVMEVSGRLAAVSGFPCCSLNFLVLSKSSSWCAPTLCDGLQAYVCFPLTND